ncbi:uncharacterized protein LOC114246340 [Bombyx mandarina]|uniref:Uncharacterized protein LOC114246340 n=1 Tax=Bombyx mandarina TaxID=7092 RepID=A0A6J2JYG2_BOMMA|nr:uncharacterized protein LOC114246340 [Bombyx mandarina]
MIKSHDFRILFSIFLLARNVCSLSQASLNDHLIRYDFEEDGTNLTNIETLQKDATKYASFAPPRRHVSLKETPDNALSSASHSRGLLHQEHSGYALNEYEETPYVHGIEYNVPDEHSVPYDHKYYDREPHHYAPHYLEHGYHYKPYNHALAAKTLLWPIAGIALLGAAAALVTNPVLLQLGVVSGRKRRDIDDIHGPDYNKKLRDIPTKLDKAFEPNIAVQHVADFHHRMTNWKEFKAVKHADRTVKKNNDFIKLNIDKSDEDQNFVPIPLIRKQ